MTSVYCYFTKYVGDSSIYFDQTAIKVSS